MAYTEESYDKLKKFMMSYVPPIPANPTIALYCERATDYDIHHSDTFVMNNYPSYTFNPATHQLEPSNVAYREHAMNLSTGQEIQYDRHNASKYCRYSSQFPVINLTDSTGVVCTDAGWNKYFADTRDNLIIIGEMTLRASEVHRDGTPSSWTFTNAFLVDSNKCRYAWKGEIQEIVSLENVPAYNVFDYAFESVIGHDAFYRRDTCLPSIDDGCSLDLRSAVTTLFPESYYPKTGKPQSTFSSWNAFMDYLEWIPSPSAKATKKILNVVDKPLPDLVYDSSLGSRNQLVVQKVEDGLCVMRFMDVTEHRSYNSSHSTTIVEEQFRIYVNKKEAISCGRFGESWGRKNLKTSVYNWRYRLLPFDKDVVKDTKLEYFYDLVQSVDDNAKGLFLWACMVEPLVEQLSKLGFTASIADMLESASWSRTALKTLLTEHFGEILKTGSPAKRLGVNNRQLKTIALWMDGHHKDDILRKMKLVMQDDMSDWLGYDFRNGSVYTDLSSLDDNTFGELYAFFAQETQSAFIVTQFIPTLGGISHIYGKQKMLKVMNMVTTAIANGKINNAWNITREYQDYLSLVQQIRAFQPKLLPCEFDPEHPDDSVTEMHNGAQDLYNLHRDQIKQKEFEEAHNRASRWAFEDDKEDYIIKVPDSADDLVNEGASLHHCVGSYVERVCSGVTNILFLRHKDAPDESFYTIEVDPSHTIQQVHGACNHNLDPGSPEEAFIKKWANKKNLHLGSYNQVR